MQINKVAVIGSGLMGHGIAQIAAMSGQEVTLIDVSQELLTKATQKINESLNKFFEKGRLKESPDKVAGRIKTATELAKGVSDADFVIEAVPEDINIKRKIFSEIEARVPRHAILATNTSGLSVTVIAEATKRKGNVIGTHWFNPPQLMRIVEIIKSKYTDDETLQTTLDVCRKYGKETIIARKDVWFFLASRAQSGLLIDASLMHLGKRADIKEVDAVAKYLIGFPMGVFELMDFTGTVEIRTKGIKSLDYILKVNPEFEPWPAYLTVMKYCGERLWKPMTEKGLTGVKAGKGFYNYAEKYAKPEIPRELAHKLEPVELLAAPINTSAWCVSNGVGSIDDLNKSFKFAYGWPKGIFEFVNELGVENIKSVLRERAKKAPAELRDFYKVDPLLANWKA